MPHSPHEVKAFGFSRFLKTVLQLRLMSFLPAILSTCKSPLWARAKIFFLK
jgi:hypothetical protein